MDYKQYSELAQKAAQQIRKLQNISTRERDGALILTYLDEDSVAEIISSTMRPLLEKSPCSICAQPFNRSPEICFDCEARPVVEELEEAKKELRDVVDVYDNTISMCAVEFASTDDAEKFAAAIERVRAFLEGSK